MESHPSGTLSEPLRAMHSTNVGQMPRLTRLRDLRFRAGLTQADLAERAEVARTTIIRLEQGDPNATPTTLRKLARVLRVKVPELWENDA